MPRKDRRAMSGTTTAPKIAGFVCTNGASVPTGTTLDLRWNAYPASAGAAELQLQASTDAGKTWLSWHRVAATATSTTKGGAADALYALRMVARKNSAEMPGSASDAVTVRVGPAPVTQPAPTPTPAPAPDNAMLAARLDALAARVTAVEGAGVKPSELRRVGASTAADEVLAVRSGEIVVVTRG